MRLIVYGDVVRSAYAPRAIELKNLGPSKP